MRMIGPGIDLQLAQLLGPEAIVRKHPLDGPPDDLFGPACEQVTERLLLEALGVAAVTAVQLALDLSDRIGLRVHRSSFSPFVRPRATCLRHSPLAGADAPSRAGPLPASAVRTAVSSILPRPTSRRTATIRRTIPRRKESARTSIVTSRPSRRTRTICTVRTGERSVAPKPLKSCRPMK